MYLGHMIVKNKTTNINSATKLPIPATVKNKNTDIVFPVKKPSEPSSVATLEISIMQKEIIQYMYCSPGSKDIHQLLIRFNINASNSTYHIYLDINQH